MKTLKNILLTLWQLPQCIVGWVMLLFLSHDEIAEYKGVKVTYSKKMRGGISLGRNIIFAWGFHYYDLDCFYTRHEYGHVRQSLMLGPLYLIVIGLPSIIWAATYDGPQEGYYKFYTEKWANKLGGASLS